MPFLMRLKNMGHAVFVCGRQPDDPCHELADGSFHVDYSDPEAIFSIARRNGFEFIVPSCNDASYLSGAFVAERLGVPGYDTLATTRILHLKSEFRAFTARHSIPSPHAVHHERGVDLALDDLVYPMLIKPVDNFSGNGMTRVERPGELAPALERAFQATRERQVLIEEYVTGSLHSHSAFIENGRIVLDFFVDEFCTVYPYQVNCSNHPSCLPKNIRRDVRRSMETIIARLGLVDGLLHTQFMQDGERHWIIECMRRCPGDLYNLMVERSTGVDYSNCYLSAFVNRPCPVRAVPPANRHIARHTVSSKTARVFLSFSARIPSDKVDVVPLKASGHRLGEAPGDKAAILFAEFPDQPTLQAITPRLAELTAIHD
jgi:biotin carboxylase